MAITVRLIQKREESSCWGEGKFHFVLQILIIFSSFCLDSFNIAVLLYGDTLRLVMLLNSVLKSIIVLFVFSVMEL